MQICLMQIFPKLKIPKKRVSSKAISTHCVLCRHNTPFASTPHYRKLFSRADAAATALQLYILSSHHAQEILPRKLEYTISLYHAKYVILTLMLATPYALVCSPCAGMIVVGLWSLKFGVHQHRRFCLGSLSSIYLPVPCQIRHIDFDALCSSPCRSDSCWVMEFKVLVKISILFLALMLAPLYALASSKSVHLPLLVYGVSSSSVNQYLEQGILILKLVDFYSVE